MWQPIGLRLLVSGAGALLLVSVFASEGLDPQSAYARPTCDGRSDHRRHAGYFSWRRAEVFRRATAEHADPGRGNAWQALVEVAIASLKDFLSRDAAVAIILFVVLFKLADALAVAMNTTLIEDRFFACGDRHHPKGRRLRRSLARRICRRFRRPVVFRSAKASGSAASCKRSRSCPFRGRPS